MSHVLILVIGGNPLPNFVVADYLSKPDRSDTDDLPVPEICLLLCSDDTRDYAHTLQRKLQIPCCIPICLGKKQRDKTEIENALKNHLTQVQKDPGISSIHLNYTGGTKLMAIHSYLVVTQFENTQRYFSYLDPERFKLIRDDNNAEYPMSSQKDLRSYVKLPVKELFEIHLMTYKGGETTTTFKKTLDIGLFAREILQDIQKKKPKWPEMFRKIDNNFKKMARLDASIRYFPCNRITLKTKGGEETLSGFKEISNGLDKRINFLGISTDLPSLSGFFQHDKFIGKGEDFTKLIGFIAGTWLEDLVLHLLLELQHEGKVTFDEIQKSVNAEYQGRPCEVDIIVMKGYQMFLISCTTSTQMKRVKLKTFEALYRAEQLGGDHAKVAVVSCASQDDIDQLDKDFQSFGAKQALCKITGMDDLLNLENLKQKLQRILKK